MFLISNEKHKEFFVRKRMKVVPRPQEPGLGLTGAFHVYALGPRKIAVKVVDIFGNDTMRILGGTT